MKFVHYPLSERSCIVVAIDHSGRVFVSRSRGEMLLPTPFIVRRQRDGRWYREDE